jgi:hypothetical protein
MLLQVSDIHISIFQDSSRILQFEDFCNVAILQVIKPEVVLVTGIRNLTYRTCTLIIEQVVKVKVYCAKYFGVLCR